MINKVRDLISNRAIIFYIFLTFLVFLILFWHDAKIGFDKVDWEGIWVEAHGMLFDIVILGLLLAIYDHFREKRDKVERYQEEIDDYRFWDEPEASYRIAGIIRRLNRLNISEINLECCELRNINLNRINLQGAKLHGVKLSGSDLSEANLTTATFQSTKYQYPDKELGSLSTKVTDALLISTVFENAILKSINFDSSNFATANFNNATIRACSFRNAYLAGANFNNVSLHSVSFDNADIRGMSIKGIKVNSVIISMENTKAYYYQEEEFVDAGFPGYSLNKIQWIENPSDEEINEMKNYWKE